MCITVCTFFITSTGQGDPAMMPVRSELKSNSLKLVCLGGDDHRRAMSGAGEVAEHHPEAVVERHRNADPVQLRVVQCLADEETVVEDVVVGQGCALRKTGRARGVLDVDGVVELQ